jgi:hypothetical protein
MSFKGETQMNISRRTLIRSGVGLAALLMLPTLPLPAVIAQEVPSPTPRTKWEVFAQDPDRLASLKRGVAAMKSRPPSDPTSWFFQAAVHGVSEAAIASAQAIDAAVADVDQATFWNQCPHSNAFNSAEFLIWHRAYVYYFERILRDAAQDPTLSLPYWNYTDLSQRRFPEQFADPEIDPATQLPGNPLFDHRRELVFAAGLFELSQDVVDITTLFQQTEFFGLTEEDGFAGGVGDNEAETRGPIEQQPHDLIHVAIGGTIMTGGPFPPDTGPEPDNFGSTNGLMAHPLTAGFDPIFWIHHSNIDRLWTVWECTDPETKSWGNVPPRAWLEAKPWSFFDFDKSVHNEARLFYLDRRNLAVSYDSDDATCTPFSATSPLSNAELGVDDTIQQFVPKAEAGRLEQEARVGPNLTRTFTVPLEPMASLEDSDAKSAIEAAPEDTPRRLILELHGLAVEGVPSVGFDVYVNVEPGVEPSRATPNYVGTISLFGALPQDLQAHGHESGDSVQRFDITELTTVEDFDPSALTVKIVPFDLLTPIEGQPRLRRPVGITFDEIRVVVVEGVPAP